MKIFIHQSTYDDNIYGLVCCVLNKSKLQLLLMPRLWFCLSVCLFVCMIKPKRLKISGVTTGGDGGSRLQAPLERGRRVLTAIFYFV